ELPQDRRETLVRVVALLVLLSEPDDRTTLVLHQLPEGAIARSAGEPVGEEPCLPLALRSLDLGIEQIDGGVAPLGDLQSVSQIHRPILAGVLRFAVVGVFRVGDGW